MDELLDVCVNTFLVIGIFTAVAQELTNGA